MMISATQGFINQSEKYSIDNAGSSLKNYTLLKKGELSYNHGYSKTRNFGSCFTLELDEARVPFVYHSFSLKNDDSSFFGKYLNSGLFDKELKKRVASTARMDGLLNISFDEYVSLIIKRPTIAEQQKIGSLLSHVDSLIQAKTKKLESLKAVKKSFLQKCFPKAGEKVPEMRFAGFSGDWEEKKLGEIADIIGGGTPDTNNEEYWNGDIDWYSPAEIEENQIYADKSERTITELGLQKSSAKILPANITVLFTSRAGIGKTAILRKPAATNQGFQSLVLKNETDTYFVY